MVLISVGVNLVETISKAKESGNLTIELYEKKFIAIGIGALAICMLSTILCLLATYNWYKTGLSNILGEVRDEDYLDDVLGDKMKYKGFLGGMKTWGNLSLATGWLTGITLAIGIFTYAYGIWSVIEELIFD